MYRTLFHAGYSNNTPIAVCDLRICPITFDFAYFLYAADTYFREKGYDKFEVYILIGNAPHSSEYNQVITAEKRRERIRKILVPLAEMYIGCKSVYMLENPEDLIQLCRGHAPVYPPQSDGRHLRTHNYREIYRIMLRRTAFSGLKPPASAIVSVDEFIQKQGIKKPFVTLTVRAYDYQPLRNTDMDAYIKFAHYLQDKGYTPIFIPDTESSSKMTFGNYASFPEACEDVSIRAAIYDQSFTNIFTSNGVHAVAAFNNNSSFILALVYEAYPESTGLKRFKLDELYSGDQPFGGKKGRFIWGEGTFSNLKENFEIVEANLTS